MSRSEYAKGGPVVRRELVGVILLSVLAAAGCGDTGDGAGGGAPVGPEPSAGQQRMIELLKLHAAEQDEDNPYMGRRRARELREQLAEASDSVPDLRSWFFHRMLGLHELILGDADAAIEHYEIAYSQLPSFADEMPELEQLKTIYEVGVAHMRDGENRNCSLRHNSDSCIFPIRGRGVHVDQEGSRNAIRYFTEVLRRAPRDSYYHVKARWLLNICHMTIAEYPDKVDPEYLIPPAAFESDEEVPRFVNIGTRLGLGLFDLAGGAVVDDVDGDHDLDIVVSTSDVHGQMRLFVNNADGSFTDRTVEAGLEGLTGGLSMIHTDYDNDGFPDVLVLRGAWWREQGRQPNSLLHNNGDGTFSDVTFEAGLGEPFYPTQTADWGDYDNDGDLDVFIGNETDQNVRAPCQLFRNNGDGTFTDVAAEAGVENLRFAKSVSWGDYDGDRDLDLYVSNIGDLNRLYRNDGDGTFTDVAPELGLMRPVSSFPSWFWDVNNDGNLDLLVSAYGGVRLPPDIAFVAASYMGIDHPGETPHLFLGDGQGGFEDVSADWNLGRVSLPMGSNFGDFDYDGWLDFYYGTGYPYYEGLEPNRMYRNVRGATFADVTTGGGFGHLQKGHGVVFADLDHDGDQDVFEQMGGFYPGDAYANALFENPGFGNHWLKIRLSGVQSNRPGIGARIRVDIVEDGAPRSIHRQVGTGGTFGGNPLRQEIGLGRASRIERLEVYWPTSDTRQVFEGLEVDRVVVVTEGDPELRYQRHEPFSFSE